MTTFSSAIKDEPAMGAITITPDDDADLTRPTRGIYIGGAGNIVCVLYDNSEVTFVGAVAGSVIPVSVRRVKSTGTTATNLIGLY